MTRPDLIAAVLADPEAVREVVEALRSGRVKVAGPWDGDVRSDMGGEGYVASWYHDGRGARCFVYVDESDCDIGFYAHGPESEARREIDARLRAAGWLLCGDTP
jgi:hypothetical protein